MQLLVLGERRDIPKETILDSIIQDQKGPFFISKIMATVDVDGISGFNDELYTNYTKKKNEKMHVFSVQLNCLDL